MISPTPSKIGRNLLNSVEIWCWVSLCHFYTLISSSTAGLNLPIAFLSVSLCLSVSVSLCVCLSLSLWCRKSQEWHFWVLMCSQSVSQSVDRSVGRYQSAGDTRGWVRWSSFCDPDSAFVTALFTMSMYQVFRIALLLLLLRSTAMFFYNRFYLGF
jgi:hypothetical protein